MTIIYLTFNLKVKMCSKQFIWQQFWVRSSIKGHMKQRLLILNQGWGKGPTFCRGNDYKWSLQLRHPLLQQLPFWLAWFSPFLTENCCYKHLTLLSDSSVFSHFLHKIKFTCSHVWSFVRPWYQAACLCFHFVFPFMGTCSLVFSILGRVPLVHARWQQMNPALVLS